MPIVTVPFERNVGCGLCVGSPVGVCVGAAVGAGEGAAVEVCVGAAVGAGVGAAVGTAVGLVVTKHAVLLAESVMNPSKHSHV